MKTRKEDVIEFGVYTNSICVLLLIYQNAVLGIYCNTFVFINNDSLESPDFRLLDGFHVTAEGPSTVLASISHKIPRYLLFIYDKCIEKH